jgi:hypothetical protein
MPNDKNAPVDPRSHMTDRAQFMVRSLHTVRIVVIVATKLAAEHKITGATEAVRRACRMLDIPDDYDPVIDPTMKACIKKMKKILGK